MTERLRQNSAEVGPLAPCLPFVLMFVLSTRNDLLGRISRSSASQGLVLRVALTRSIHRRSVEMCESIRSLMSKSTRTAHGVMTMHHNPLRKGMVMQREAVPSGASVLRRHGLARRTARRAGGRWRRGESFGEEGRDRRQPGRLFNTIVKKRATRSRGPANADHSGAS